MANNQIVVVTQQKWASRNLPKDEQEEDGQMHLFVARLMWHKGVRLSDSPFDALKGGYYSGLRATCDIPSFIAAPDCERATTTRHRVEYGTVQAINLCNVVRLLETLEDVECKLERAHRDEGPVEHFAQYGARFAQAVGAELMLIECENYEPSTVEGFGRRYRIVKDHFASALRDECRKMECFLQPSIAPDIDAL